MNRLLLQVSAYFFLSSAVLCTADEAPSFIEEPPAVVEFSNQSGVKVPCVARGSPSPKVSWITSEGAPISAVSGLMEVTNNSTLLFHPFQASSYRPDVHAATYRCIVSNSVGMLLSRLVRTRAVLMQQYEARVVSASVVKGNTAVLRCVVPETIKRDIVVTSWVQEFTGLVTNPSTFGDGKYHMAQTGDLYIHSVDKTDQHISFRCRTRHRLAESTELSVNSATVTVIEPLNVIAPTIVIKPEAVVAEPGSEVSLPCIAQGFPAPRVKWYRLDFGGQQISIEDSFDDSYIFLLEYVQPEDSATYRCIASNEAGNSQIDVKVEVRFPISVTIQPSDVRVDQGASIDLHCAHTGSPRAVVTWLKDSTPLSFRDRYHLIGRDKLHIVSMLRSDQGVFQCFVEEDGRTIQASARVRLGDAAPQIIHPFNEQTLIPGPFVTLKCAAIGNPLPEISWQLDGYPVQTLERVSIGKFISSSGEVTSYLNITTVHVEDGGQYTCKASNKAGTATHSARLNVYGLPLVRPMPPVSVVSGFDASLRCAAAGFPLADVIWMKGEEVLSEGSKYLMKSSEFSLTVRSAAKGLDDGHYSCKIRDRQGNSAQGDITLKVAVPPKIAPFQMDPLLRLGERLTLTCAITMGDSPFSINWLLDGQLLNSRDIKTLLVNSHTSILSIDSVQPNQSGNYTCSVSNAAAVTTHSQMIFIQVLPRIEPFAFADDLTEGMRTSVLCGVRQGDLPMEVAWKKDDRPFYGLPSVTIKELDAFSSVLVFANVSASHAGFYECVVRNPGGITRYGAELRIQVPPFWEIEPANTNVLKGQSVTIPCRARGYPNPSVKWSRLIGSNMVQITNQSKGGVHVFPNGTLFIRWVKTRYSGNYSCQAEGKSGQLLTRNITVSVNVGPRFRENLARVVMERGQSAALKCHVEGDTPLQFAWRKSASPATFLSSNNRFRVQDQQLHRGATSTVTLKNTQLEDSGIYICIARNAHGQIERETHLIVQEPPDPPRHLQIAEVSSRSVSLSWLDPHVNLYNPVIGYIVQFRLVNDSLWQERSIGSGKTQFTLDGLQPSSTYSIRLAAETSAGRGLPTEALTAATHGEAPGESPSSLKANALSSTRIRITWLGLDRTVWYSRFIGYQVGYRQENADFAFQFATIPLTDYFNTMDYHLDSLRKNTRYVIAVRAFNGFGEGPLSQPVVVSTLEDAPSAAPVSVRCGSATSQSLQVSWQPPPQADQNGYLKGYRIYYEPTALLKSSSSPVQSKIVTSPGASVTGLQPFTSYSIRIESFNQAGTGPSSPAVVCTTEEEVPGPPTDVRVYTTGFNSISLCWSPPIQPNGEILHYSIYLRAGSGSKVVKYTVSGSQTFYEINELSEQQFYEISLTASTRRGDGEKSRVNRHSLSHKAGIAICSSERSVLRPWKSQVRLSCYAVGLSSAASWTWSFNEKMIYRGPEDSRLATASDHYSFESARQLIVREAKKTDEGNYTCVVKSGSLVDSIHYKVTIAVPPSAPLLRATQSSYDAVELSWKVEDVGAAHVQNYFLNMRKEDHDWEEIELQGLTTTYQYKGLSCGTRYQFYVTAKNAVGASGPSNIVAARTKGDSPIAPTSPTHILSIDTNFVGINLRSWQERGCPVQSFSIHYRMEGNSAWITSLEDIKPLPVIYIEDLQPATAYNLRVTARTAGASVRSNYDFVTMDTNGTPPAPERINRFGRLMPVDESPVMVVLPWWIVTVVTTVGVISVLGLVSACYCLHKTRREMRQALPSLHTDSTLTEHWNKSRTKSSNKNPKETISKGSECELRSIGKFSDTTDDIYPYATFEGCHERNPSRSSMENAPPVPKQPPPGQYYGQEKYRRRKTYSGPPAWSELSTIEIESHFQRSPVASESDLEIPVSPGIRGTKREEEKFSSLGYKMGRKCPSKMKAVKEWSHLPKDPDYSKDPLPPLPAYHPKPPRNFPKKPNREMLMGHLPHKTNLWSGDYHLENWDLARNLNSELPPCSPDIDHSVAV